MAVEGSATKLDLKHHALADEDGDPHSPLGGLVHAYLGWFFRGEPADPKVYNVSCSTIR
jgi:stearoyl-CoA desaturase (delta-9 desaturase)